MAINPNLDSYLPWSMLWMVTTSIFFLANLTSSSDPCPPASKLRPCWCTDMPLLLETTTTETTWTTTNTTASYSTQPTSSTAASSSSSTTPPAERRRRRHVSTKGQIDSSANRTRSHYYTVVTCNNTNNSHDLEEGIGEGLKKRWVDRLVLSNIRIDAGDDTDTPVRLPNRLFKDTRIKDLEIRDTYLAGDFIHYGNPLDGQSQSIIWFTVTGCFLGGQLSYSDVGTVNTKGLESLMRLECLEISRNYLVSIRSLAFRFPPLNLTNVILHHNNIEVVEYNAFSYIPKLQYVDLSHNRLETLMRNVFPSPAKTLLHINLSWNRFASFSDDFFSNMPALKIVDVSNNFLYSIPSKPWASVWRQLQFMDFTGNYLLCDCSLLWLLPILSPVTNETSTPSPQPLPGQTVLGCCSNFEHNSYSKHHALVNLTRSSLNC